MGAVLRFFRDSEGCLDGRLLFVFSIVNGIVLYNAILHDPAIQYDSEGHLANIAALARLHLPTASESSEFFSPPLPYLLPAVAKAAGLDLWSAAKLGQFVNVALSLGLTGLLIVLCRAAWPSNRATALVALMCLGVLPVYYKTMAFVRGEPYVAFLTLAAMAATGRAIGCGGRLPRDAIVPGACWALLALARQWGALAAAGLLLAVWLAVLRDRSRRLAAVGVAAPLVALLLGGWFYGWLWMSEGSPLAFNRTSAPRWTPLNQPADFYLGTGNGRLFTDPIRPSFPNQLVPIFYADTWGDYWGFFSIYGKDPGSGDYVIGPPFEQAIGEAPPAIETNRFTLNKYLGHVNLLWLLPSILALVAFVAAASRLCAFLRLRAPAAPPDIIPIMAVLVIAVSALGYLWFLIRFPNPGKGDTIKATYMLHVFAPLALLVTDFLRRVHVPPNALILAWTMLMAHNVLAITTHFSDVPWL